ncbi:unnamed protein product [Lasius platythorax]|uniref:Uncharacterized protein n=1 Tax=Lasius platythorax TaxID=488582 RepID=A0AAV2P567_9HYME
MSASRRERLPRRNEKQIREPSLDKSNAVGNDGGVRCVDRDSKLTAKKKKTTTTTTTMKAKEESKAQDKRERASSPWRPWYALIGVPRKGVASFSAR